MLENMVANESPCEGVLPPPVITIASSSEGYRTGSRWPGSLSVCVRLCINPPSYQPGGKLNKCTVQVMWLLAPTYGFESIIEECFGNRNSEFLRYSPLLH